MSAPEVPVMLAPQRVTGSWTVLPSWLPVPGMGGLPVNSFLLRSREPVLVDTGLAALGDELLDALEQEIDPADLRWIWLSHMDADHAGNLARVLERAPGAEVVTSFLGMGKMGLAGLDTSRARVLEPGAALDAGDRRLRPLRPPYYDAPESLGFFDERERVLFTVDAFGALLPEVAEELDDVPEETLREGLAGWAAVDAPWLAQVDGAALGRTLGALERLDPDHVLSGHLPCGRRRVTSLTAQVAEAARRAAAAADPLAIARAETALA